MEPRAVFSTASFPTIEYVSALIDAGQVLMEGHESFFKQTNRNRYHIGSPSGVQTLHIPLRHQHLQRQPVNRVCISYNDPWQRNHWRTLTSAYNRSAYFEFYMDELQPLFFRPYEYLLEFNNAMLGWILRCLKASPVIIPTTSYINDYEKIRDLRYLSNRKSNEPANERALTRYPQVFETESGFVRNLCLPDLLFNMGPAAVNYLYRSGKHTTIHIDHLASNISRQVRSEK